MDLSCALRCEAEQDTLCESFPNHQRYRVVYPFDVTYATHRVSTFRLHSHNSHFLLSLPSFPHRLVFPSIYSSVQQMNTLGETLEQVGVTLTNNLPTSAGTMSTSKATNGSSSTVNKKLQDLEKDVYDVHQPQHMTTDFGHKVSDTDHWLKVGSKDQVGAHLLEDQVGREKVGTI